jgi:hypothetical protein
MRSSGGRDRASSHRPGAVKASAGPDARKATRRSADPSGGENGAEAGSQDRAKREARATASETETSAGRKSRDRPDDYLKQAWFWLLVVFLLSVLAACFLYPDLVANWWTGNQKLDDVRILAAGVLLGVAGSAAVGAIQEWFHRKQDKPPVHRAASGPP